MRQQITLLILVAELSACASFPTAHAWGQDATLSPGWEKVQPAAIDAARSPMTWAPLLAAGLLQIDNADENLSAWASDDTPIFGSRQTADTSSTDLMRASVGLYAVTALATPSGDEHWLENKAKGLGIGLAAEVTTARLSRAPRIISRGLKNTYLMTIRSRTTGRAPRSSCACWARSVYLVVECQGERTVRDAQGHVRQWPAPAAGEL